MKAWKITGDRFRGFISDAKSQIWRPLSDQTWADFVFKMNSFDWTPNTRVNLTKVQRRGGEDVCGETSKLAFPSGVQTKFHRVSSSDGQKGPRRVLTVHTQAT